MSCRSYLTLAIKKESIEHHQKKIKTLRAELEKFSSWVYGSTLGLQGKEFGTMKPAGSSQVLSFTQELSCLPPADLNACFYFAAVLSQARPRCSPSHRNSLKKAYDTHALTTRYFSLSTTRKRALRKSLTWSPTFPISVSHTAMPASEVFAPAARALEH